MDKEENRKNWYVTNIMPDAFHPRKRRMWWRKIETPLRNIAVAGFFVGVLIFTFRSFNISKVFGATYNFVQTSWSGGASSTAIASNPNGWNYYQSASTTINFASALTLTTSTYSFTDDATTSTTSVFPAGGGGFGNG